jgi:outer membrane protein assembly factor BamE (lipoprotein component of BamABCDE complex)
MKGTSLAGAFVLALLLPGCSPVFRNHGYVPPDSVLSQLTLGAQSREEVIATLGRPTTAGILGDQSLYYVQSRFRNFAFLPPEEVDRQVLAVSFTPDGRLGNIERFGLEAGRVVRLSPETTAEVFADRTFINQLLNSIGNFDAGTFLGDE